MSYATWWCRVWCVLVAMGVGFASLQWTPLVVILAVLTTAAGVGLCLLALENRRRPTKSAMRATDAAGTTGRSLIIGCGLVAMSALVADSPAVALLVALLALITSPLVVRRRSPRHVPAPAPARRTTPRAGRRRDASPPPDPRETPPADPVLSQLDDAQLFRLWRATFWDLHDQPSAPDVARLVERRQSLLDEMARRDPAALNAWLESGARASSGPERFWRHRHVGPEDDASHD